MRTAGLTATLLGAVGSVGLMLRAGHSNPSRLLLIFFALWVLSPFVALVMADDALKRWSFHSRSALHYLMLMVALASLVIYGVVALGPPRPQTAFVFVVVPPASWLLLAIVVSILLVSSKRGELRE